MLAGVSWLVEDTISELIWNSVACKSDKKYYRALWKANKITCLIACYLFPRMEQSPIVRRQGLAYLPRLTPHIFLLYRAIPRSRGRG